MDFSGFEEWLDEAIRTDISGMSDASNRADNVKDPVGFPILQHGGFRKSDLKMVQGGIPIVEMALTRACSNSTRQIGINWVCCYLSPKPEMQTIDDPEDVAMTVRDALKKGKAGWDQYRSFSQQHAEMQLDEFIRSVPGATKSNTVVYIKPTSRVHGLSPWQMMHNKGHAVWTHARENREFLEADEKKRTEDIISSIRAAARTAAAHVTGNRSIERKFVLTLREMFDRLHRQSYDTTGRAPNAKEMTLMLARVLPVGASFRRIFTATPDGSGSTSFDTPAFRANTAFNSFQEAMFDLIAVWMSSGGRIPIKTSGPVKDTHRDPQKRQTLIPDRQAAVPPDAPWRKEVERKFGGKVRPYVYEPLIDSAEWEQYAEKLSDIVAEAIRACVWDKVGGPIYATKGYITTGA